jgi:hypothetical protein
MKGDAQWVFDRFRQLCLPAFISDLKALEATGFQNPNSCPRVGRCLKEVADVLESIPNVRPPAPTAAAEFREFSELYQEWNHKSGDSPENRVERSRAHESLDRKRERFADRVGQSLPKLKDKVDWKTMDSIFEKLDAMVQDKDLEGVFHDLSKTLEKLRRKAEQYRIES